MKINLHGLIFFISYLSTSAQSLGDTAKAVKRILDYLTCMNGNTVVLAQKLKPILLQKYTQKEITTAVRRGLKKLTYMKSEKDSYYICLPLF